MRISSHRFRRAASALAVAAIAIGAGLTAADRATAADVTTSKPPVAVAASKSGLGYWVVAGDGGVFSFGDAGFHGSMGGKPLNAPMTAMAVTPSGKGYWLAATDGGVFAFGDAPAKGSMGGQRLNAPVRGITATPSGQGYWLAGADGGIFAFGDAPFYGSMGGKPLNAPVVGITATPTGKGYWLVAADGGIFAYGDALFYGSMGGQHLARPVIGMAGVRNDGYLMVAGDGGIFAFGAATYRGRVVYSGSSGSTLPADATVTPAMLKEALGIASTASVTDGLPSLNAAMRRGGINSPARVAAFLATLKAESALQYNRLEMGCTASTKYYPYCGRGYIQLTLKANYAAAGKYLNRDFVNNREEPRSIAYSAEVARWFWTVTHDLNGPADRMNMGQVTRAVNGTAASSATLQARCADFKKVLTYYKNHGGYNADLSAVICS
jgi:predicted chitinase